MAELIKSPVAFTSLHGEQHQVTVTTNWDVVVDDTRIEGYLGPAAVVILGFMNSLDSAVNRETFYGTVLAGYDTAIESGSADPVDGIDIARNGTNIGGILSSLISPKSSIFRTNILALSMGVQKRLLICSNPYDDEFVAGVIDNSTLSENPGTNLKFQAMLLAEYKARKDFLMRYTGKSSKPLIHSTRGASPEYIASLSTGITEVSTSATRRRFNVASPKPVVFQEDINDFDGFVIKEYIPEKEVLKTTGALLFDAEPGKVFTVKQIVEELAVHHRHELKVQNAIEALRSAGFLVQKFADDEVVYVRTDKQKDW